MGTQLISNIASGEKIKLGAYNGTDLQWKVCRDTSNNKIRFVLDAVSVPVLGDKQYDAPEPNNEVVDRQFDGNNYHAYSNIFQWLNATQTGNSWYTAQHEADAPPDYADQAGFLNSWKQEHLDALENETWEVNMSQADFGPDFPGDYAEITYTFDARVTLISRAELDGGLDIFNSNDDRSIGKEYFGRTPNSSQAALVVGVVGVDDYGYVTAGFGSYTPRAIRPLCSPKSNLLISSEKDSDGCYTIVGPGYADYTNRIVGERI